MALSALALAALVLRAVAYLASWYPGDETIRASSESFLRLMFSRSGVSFGTTKSFAFAREVTIDAGDAIKTTREAAVVQGEIARVPRWRAGEDVNVTRHALVPKHDKVDAPPPSTSVEALPKILTTDRVVQYYAWPVGTVVRVWRCYGGHEPVPYFRVVAAA